MFLRKNHRDLDWLVPFCHEEDQGCLCWGQQDDHCHVALIVQHPGAEHVHLLFHHPEGDLDTNTVRGVICGTAEAYSSVFTLQWTVRTVRNTIIIIYRLRKILPFRFSSVEKFESHKMLRWRIIYYSKLCKVNRKCLRSKFIMKHIGQELQQVWGCPKLYPKLCNATTLLAISGRFIFQLCVHVLFF